MDDQSDKRKSFLEILKNSRLYLKLCFKENCRRVSYVIIISYLLIFLIMGSCAFFSLPYCLSSGFFGGSAIGFTILAISIAVSVILALLSRFSRTAIIFLIIATLPILGLILYGLISYTGIVVIAIIFLLLISESQNRYY